MPIKSIFRSTYLNKKLLCSIGVPIISSFSALGRNVEEVEYKIMVNYNGQADLLLSLQIPPDYYPYQFKKFNLYDYLTNVNKYVVSNDQVSENKKSIASQLQKKVNEHLSKIKEFGPSLWNEDLYDTGIVFRNNQFWSQKKTVLLFLEQFIADDYQDIREAYGLLPRHKELIVTNYRAARDPYTIFSKKIFDCFGKGDDQCQDDTAKKIYTKFKKYMQDYDREETNSLYRFGRFIDFWNNLVTKNESNLTTLKFYDLIKEENKNLFSINQEEDKKLAKKYLDAVFTKEEICYLNKWNNDKEVNSECNDEATSQASSSDPKWEMHYLSQNAQIKTTHHPALEQQIIPGSAPLSEGSQKDIIVFLYQFAASIDTYTKSSDFSTQFKDDYRQMAMSNALNNAYKMSQNLNNRIDKIRDYFKKIKVVDSSFNPAHSNYTTDQSKTFTVLTYPPSAFGAGEATIQSMSKFPWLYRDIGLKQPIPSGLQEHMDEDLSKETFSVDDNGWWWKIGSANLDPTNLLKFKGTSDTLLILANEDDWNLLQDKTSGTLSAAVSLLKDSSISEIDINKIQGNEPKLKNNNKYPVSYNKYHLWNEGLRSPIALNLLLDNLVDIFQRQYHSELQDHQQEYQAAMDWGDYWHDHFLKGTHASAPTSSQ